MLRLANVVATHPGSVSVDLVMLDTSERIFGVQVLSDDMSSDSGSWSVPDVPLPASEASAGQPNVGGRTMLAVCAPLSGRLVVMGFLKPPGGQIAFTEGNRTIYRHASGGYATWAPDGSYEVYHPSGAYLRMGTGPHEDLSSKSFAPWASPTGAAAPTITMQTEGAVLTIAPGGAVTLDAPGGEMTCTYQHATMNGPMQINGVVTTSADVHVGGTLSASVDVVADGVSGKSHVHGGVAHGGLSTNPPT